MNYKSFHTLPSLDHFVNKMCRVSFANKKLGYVTHRDVSTDWLQNGEVTILPLFTPFPPLL